MRTTILSLALNALLVSAACPFMEPDGEERLARRSGQTKVEGDDGFLKQFYVDDSDTYTTTDSGTPIDDFHSLKAGARGPTLLEDFAIRTKITRFDHERIPERAGTSPLMARWLLLLMSGNSSRPWCSCPWLLRELRRLLQHHGRFLPGPGWKADAHIPAIFYCCWVSWELRHCT